MGHDYYEFIGVSRTATHEEILAACIRLGEKCRPDLHAQDPGAVETFELLERAFETLSIPEKRAAYDLELAVSAFHGDRQQSPVKIMDAGHKLLISGTEADEVKAVLDDYLARGSTIVTVLSRVGSTWVAACTMPAKAHPADTTTTLNLSDLRDQSEKPFTAVEGGECNIQQFGLKVWVTGPTQPAVVAKAEELVELGATLVGEIALQEDGQWLAICDTGGYQNTGYRW